MYDPLLAEYLKRGGRNAQYSSKTIQNEIIGTAAKLIQKSIVDEVNSGKYFAVLADDASDVARLEQLSISALEQQKLLREQFQEWTETNGGVGSFSRIEAQCKKILDEASTLSTETSGSSEISEEVSGGFLSKVYIPFMSGLMTELETRFSCHFELTPQIQLLLPPAISTTHIEDISETFDFYGLVLPHEDTTLFDTEFQSWKRK
ncbi:hypothetical protein Aduo_002185 [Ancylostoma duodenale]